MTLKTWVNGEKVLASDLNNNFSLFSGGFTPNAGETINGETLPVPVYQSSADSEVYACDANDSAKLRFIGFAISNSTNGNPITVTTNGIVGGFSGLTVGSIYYVQDTAGSIGTTPGTNKIPVGVAISTTQILIIKLPRITSGNTTKDCNNTTSTTIAHGLGVIPRLVRISIKGMASGDIYSADAVLTDVQSSNSVYMEGGSSSGVGSSNTFKLDRSGSDELTGTITVDATNITIAWSGTTFSSTANIVWEAYE